MHYNSPIDGVPVKGYPYNDTTPLNVPLRVIVGVSLYGYPASPTSALTIMANQLGKLNGISYGYPASPTPALTLLLYVILGLLMVLFLILIINLFTFPRLRPTTHGRPQGSPPLILTTPAPTGDVPPVGAGVADDAGRGPLRSPVAADTDSLQPVGAGVADDAGRGPLRSPAPENTPPTSDKSTPLVSILVPARNEEQCIETCIRSLIAQHYEPLEILVLDDHSTDATPMLVQKIIAELPPAQQGRLRLIQSKPLPSGWVGKNFACQQLAQHAHGDYLLFTDADTQHAPNMVTAVMACMHTYKVSLLTAQPEHVLGSLGECLIVPLLNFTIFTLLPVALIPRRPEPSLATGNGQLLCFERTTYHAIGGHEHVKGSILEDVLLARATKAAGYRMIFVDALELVRCRMYHSFADVWSGFSKNLFAFYNYSLPFALIALLLNLLLFVFPPLLLLLSPFIHLSNATLLAATSAYLLVVLMRLLLTVRFVRTQRIAMFVLCFLHPLAILLECLILLNSIRWRYSKRGIMWKGRSYNS